MHISITFWKIKQDDLWDQKIVSELYLAQSLLKLPFSNAVYDLAIEIQIMKAISFSIKFTKKLYKTVRPLK